MKIMSAKTIVMLGMIGGSLLGGYIPVFFGAESLSVTSIIGNAVGGFAGIFIAYRLTQM
jgi:hypothetical protein